jgi:hypothetical protein
MGAGNYFLDNAHTVYVDHDQVYGEWDSSKDQYQYIETEDDFAFHYDDFIDGLTDLIPATYSFFTEVNIVCGYRECRRIVAENGFYNISVVDYHSYFAVNVELKAAREGEPWEFNPLAVHGHARAAARIFDSLATRYQLRIRTCAWTSGKRAA